MKPVVITGVVEMGAKRGRTLGYPTYNLSVQQTSLTDGIYISETSWQGQRYPSATFIGRPVTFDDQIWRIETHILDFDQDLYGQEVTLMIREKIRDNQKFDSIETLLSQMEQDIAAVRKYFSPRS